MSLYAFVVGVEPGRMRRAWCEDPTLTSSNNIVVLTLYIYGSLAV